ncbi:MAG: lytic murein transglycosylase [Hyphomicrobiaceae bacterium]
MLARPFLALLALAALLVMPPSAHAADAKFRQWLEALWPEAEALGVSRATFEAAFRGVEPNRSLPDLAPAKGTESKGQAEFIKSPGAYINESQIQTLAQSGKAYAAKWKADLDRIERHYGVPRTIILGIWGRETVYGTHKLPHNAVRVLATQAYLGRRKDYFRNELLWALKILEEGHVRLADMRSSWGGAMGLTQMLPTNFRDFAEDFDGDGHRNIWTSIPDSLASTARSLKGAKHIDGSDVSWIAGQPWGYEVRKPARFDCTLEGIANRRPIRDWVALGFTRAYDRKFKESQLDDEAFLLMPEGIYGPAFLATRNFLALKSYNYADLYALFVGHLADRIAGGKPFETPWAKLKPMREKDVMEMQERLTALGLYADKIDGKAGMITRVALGQFEQRAGVESDCYPTSDDLQALRQAQ